MHFLEQLDHRAKKRKFDSPSAAISMSTETSTSIDHTDRLSLSEQYDRRVRPYIDLIDSLRSSGVDEDVSHGLPTVIVIGDQSSGKSSVLEAISGVQLPRGQGMVTRCALELKMTRSSSKWQGLLHYEDPKSKEFVEVSLIKPEEVEDAVKQAQTALAGQSKSISQTRIELTVTSPYVPDLTLIDLPGIIQNTTEDQPGDLPEQIKILIRNFASREATIMLCVIPCPQDIASNMALAEAKSYDPQRERSVGVLTRPDLTGKGEETTIVRLVQRNDMGLKLGYTIVKCRSQEEIEAKVPLAESLQNEKRFFQEHKHFSKLPEGCTGIPNLARKLTNQLVAHIKSCLPRLYETVRRELKETTSQVSKLDKPVPENKKEYLIQLLLEYANSLKAVTNGQKGVADVCALMDCTELADEGDGVSDDEGDHDDKAGGECASSSHQLYKMARETFERFEKTLDRLIPSNEDLPDIERLIKDFRGPELIGFENYRVFQDIARKKVEKMQAPALKCLNAVEKLVEEVFDDLAEKYFGRFANLHQAVVGRVLERFRESVTGARNTISMLMQTEKIIYSSDSTYNVALEETGGRQGQSVSVRNRQSAATSRYGIVGGPQLDMTVPLTSQPSGQLSPPLGHKMLHKLQAYFKVVTRRLCDNIPMAIMQNLFKSFTNGIEGNLISHFVSGSSISPNDQDGDNDPPAVRMTPDFLLEEDEEVARQRELLQQKQKRLEGAAKKLKMFSGRKRRREV